MKQCYIQKNFSKSSMSVIARVNDILDEYAKLGYTLTLRQLYYQLVARGFVENTLQSYKRVGGIVSDARLAGLVDWDMIKDRGRTLVSPPHWDSPAEIVDAAARQFRINKWADQDYHLEVMVEKDALSGVLMPVCHRLDISFTANRGYSSSSAMHEAGLRMIESMNEDKTVIILYLGDHDPSGIDMTRDVRERLGLFAETEIEVMRLALNFDQVEALHPPENPAKESDSRAAAYIAQFGPSSWELDAVEPRELDRLVTRAVIQFRDDERWDAQIEREQKMRAELDGFVKNYNTKGR